MKLGDFFCSFHFIETVLRMNVFTELYKHLLDSFCIKKATCPTWITLNLCPLLVCILNYQMDSFVPFYWSGHADL